MSASASKQPPSFSKPPKNPNPITHADPLNPNPTVASANLTMSSPIPPTLPPQDVVLSRASHVTRQELLKRRLHLLRQLSRCYRDHYWALMEDLKIQYRDYYWKFGASPFKHDHNQEPGDAEIAANPTNNVEGSGDNVNSSNYINNNNNPSLDFKNNHRCLFVGCKFKAMALTSFCHLHILSDSKQKLYKACTYVIKSAHAGPITCGKPILRSTIPSLCTVHFQKAQKHVNRALKKAGLNVSSSSKLAPKFHVIVAEYVHQIQAKRRAALKGITSKATIKEESAD